MMYLILIALVLVAFLTYKPLFRLIKTTKGDKESIKEEIFKEDTREEFKDFAKKQSKQLGGFLGLLVRIYAKLSNVLVFIANANAKCANYLASKTGKRDSTAQSSQANTQNQTTQSDAQSSTQANQNQQDSAPNA